MNDTGCYVLLETQKRHRCQLPGGWARRRDNVQPGSVWACKCGRQYELQDSSDGGNYWTPLPKERYISRQEST